jgi:DNA-binding transcriptional MerR regulator
VGQIRYSISDVARETGMTPDTLRYYERIGLLTHVPRTAGGARRYSEANLTAIRFIQRAQKMNFSLKEIGQLLQMREIPAQACHDAKALAEIKLEEIDRRIDELCLLKKELQLLTAGCAIPDNDNCAFLQGLEQDSQLS